jgi:CPA1 family monovalent cation:H+ antiporter
MGVLKTSSVPPTLQAMIAGESLFNDGVGLGVLPIPLVLTAPAVSVGAPPLFWRRLLPFNLAFPVMTWDGLRGRISIALALSLPAGPMKDILLAAT